MKDKIEDGTEEGVPAVAIWHCLEDGCDFRVNRFGGQPNWTRADWRTAPRIIVDHYDLAHPEFAFGTILTPEVPHGE